MKIIIILTILITSQAFAYDSMKEYAEDFEAIANTKLKASTLTCFDNDHSGYYQCVLERDWLGSVEQFEGEYGFLRFHAENINKGIAMDGTPIPPLHIYKKD